jgi:replicative DNA helicase
MSSDISQLVPPHNIEAEMTVLGSILTDQALIHEIIGVIQPEDFYSAMHERIFSSMLILANSLSPIDAITLAEKAHHLKPEEQANEFAYYAKLLDIVPSADNIRHYAAIVKEKSALRAILRAASGMTRLAYLGEDNVERTFSEAEALWKKACDQKCRVRGALNLAEAIKENYYRVTDLAYGQAVSAVQKTPWRAVNEYLGGFCPGNLIVWAGAPKAGKSGAVLTLADYVAATYGTVMYCSMELTLAEMVMRYVALYSGVSVKRQLEGNLSEKELMDMSDVQGQVAERSMSFYGRESCKSLPLIRSELRDLKRKEHVVAMVIDGVNFLSEVDASSSSDRSSKNDRMDRVYRDILSLGSENQVVSHVVTHINREGQKNGHPKMSDIRDGGNPEGHAHAVIMPYRENALSNVEADREEGQFVIAATRTGSAGVLDMSFKLGRGLWLGRDDKRPWFEIKSTNNAHNGLKEASGF